MKDKIPGQIFGFLVGYVSLERPLKRFFIKCRTIIHRHHTIVEALSGFRMLFYRKSHISATNYWVLESRTAFEIQIVLLQSYDVDV